MISDALAHRKGNLHTKCAQYTAPDAEQSPGAQKKKKYDTTGNAIAKCFAQKKKKTRHTTRQVMILLLFHLSFPFSFSYKFPLLFKVGS